MNESLLKFARTFLFVPASRPDRYGKALASAADAVVFDLEDAVAAADKDDARRALIEAWAQLSAVGKGVMIRISSPDSSEGQKDLQMLAQLQSTPGIMVAKAESGDTLRQVRAACSDAPLIPLVESARGYQALADIAGAEGVVRLAVGHIDFMAETGIQCSENQIELLPLRFAVTMQSALHRLAGPVDGVTVEINDAGKVRADALMARRMGFRGKLCIHPRQVAEVRAVFTPSEEEVDWARRVIEGSERSGGAAFQLDGQMVDMPVVIQAQRILEYARG